MDVTPATLSRLRRAATGVAVIAASGFVVGAVGAEAPGLEPDTTVTTWVDAGVTSTLVGSEVPRVPGTTTTILPGDFVDPPATEPAPLPLDDDGGCLGCGLG